MRARQDGCTPREILDAILHAFPALGLTKIVWAIDILLSMDIPEFRPEYLDATAGWHELLPTDKIPDGKVTYAAADGRNLFIYRANGETRVYDSRCPHQVTNIPHLALEGSRLTCPKHQWAFDIKTGKCVERATARSNISRPRSRTASCTRAGSKTELSNQSSSSQLTPVIQRGFADS